jgi:hypothetical protein
MSQAGSRIIQDNGAKWNGQIAGATVFISRLLPFTYASDIQLRLRDDVSSSRALDE